MLLSTSVASSYGLLCFSGPLLIVAGCCGPRPALTGRLSHLTGLNMAFRDSVFGLGRGVWEDSIWAGCLAGVFGALCLAADRPAPPRRTAPRRRAEPPGSVGPGQVGDCERWQVGHGTMCQTWTERCDGAKAATAEAT